MAYYEDRRYRAPRDRARPVSYAPEYYEEPRYARYDREVYPEDSVEEIQRDYPPGDPYAYERGYDSRRSRRPVYETVRRASSVSGHDPYYDGYSRSRPRGSQYDDRRSRRRYDSPSPSPSPPRHRRRKSFSEQAMSAIGLGSSKYDSDRGRDRSSDRRRRYDSYSRSRSRDRDDKSRRGSRSEQRLAQAARAALAAGAVEAFRARKDPGEWTGDKGKRVLTAAVTAAGTDGLVDRDPRKHGKRHVLESTLAGLAASHFMNNGRSSSRGRNSRSGRGRSASGGLKDLAATGALAAAGKEIYDRISRSRSRPRGRADSDSEDDRRGSKKRSKSVSEYITKGISALGLGGESRDRDDRGTRRRSDRRSRRDYDSYSDTESESDYHRDNRTRDSRRRRDSRDSRDVGRYRSLNGKNPLPPNDRRAAPTSAPRGGENAALTKKSSSHSSSSSDSDLGDSSDEKEKHKKMRRDMLITGGLATVATIHAAHSVYSGVEKRKKRMKELEEGKITPEEARKRRIKANTLDAASVGIAALGITGAYKEWQEVNEKRKEHQEFQKECEERAKKRMLKRSQSHASSTRHRWPDEIEYPSSRSSPLAHQSAPIQPQISY